MDSLTQVVRVLTSGIVHQGDWGMCRIGGVRCRPHASRSAAGVTCDSLKQVTSRGCENSICERLRLYWR
jgi:hypothetical protein